MKKTKSDVYYTSVVRRHFFPVLIWFGVLACVVFLFTRRHNRRFDVIGVVQGHAGEIAATTTGRLKSINVELYDRVQKDDTLALLDEARISAELATAAANINQLNAEVKAAAEQLLAQQADLKKDLVAQKRRFDLDVEQTRLREMELTVTLETDHILLEDLELELKFARELAKKNIFAPYEVQKRQLQYDTLAKKIQENQKLLNKIRDDFKIAKSRQADFETRQPGTLALALDTIVDPIRKNIEVQQQIIEELKVDREALVLKAPFNGLVSQILRRPGDAVLAGETILVVEAEARPVNIVAYVPNQLAATVQPGQNVQVITRTTPPLIESTQIAQVGPLLEQLPIQLWKSPNFPEWGRPFLVRIPPDWKLLPGETVGIRRNAP